MKDLPFVSIVMASLNGRHLLPAVFSSIENLNYPRARFEVILVDDGSTDSTAEFVKEDLPYVRLIRNGMTIGPAASRNGGIKAARGEIVAFLDNDVEPDKEWLRELVQPFEDGPAIGISCSKILFKDKPNVINSTGGVMNIYADAWDRGVFEMDKKQYDDARRVFFGCSAAMAARRDVLEKAGCFDPALNIYEDADLGWRVNLLGYKVIYAPASLAYHRRGSTIVRGTLRAKYELERSRLRTMIKNYEAKTLWGNAAGLARFKLLRFNRHPAGPNQPRLALAVSALAAWAWNILHIPGTLKERRRIRRVKALSDDEIFKLMGNYKYGNLTI